MNRLRASSSVRKTSGLRAKRGGRWFRHGRNIILPLDHQSPFSTELDEILPGVLQIEQSPGHELGLDELSFDEILNESPTWPTLRTGSRGAAVIELQRRLNAWIATNAAPGQSRLSEDGAFGPLTRAAVLTFQRANGLTVDGIVGRRTWERLTGSMPDSPSPSISSEKWVLPADVRAAGEAQFVRYDSPPPWANGRNCSGTFTPGAAELGTYIRRTFPGVDSVGGYACRFNSATPSETSVHGVGRALDIMIREIDHQANSAVGDPIANWLVQNASAIGIQFVIWNRIKWNGSRSGRKDGNYAGPSPHTNHIHTELNLDGARRLTPWFKSRSGAIL